MPKNQEKLAKLQAQVCIIWERTACRKKMVHRTAAQTILKNKRKLQLSLKKWGVSSVSGSEEVNMFTHHGTGIHFNNHKVQANGNASQHPKSAPGRQSDSSKETGWSSAQSVHGRAPLAPGEDGDDEVPELVENSDEAPGREANWTEATSEEGDVCRSYRSCCFMSWLLLKILLLVDLIKSRALIFSSPSALDTAALFSFCSYTIRSLRLIKPEETGR